MTTLILTVEFETRSARHLPIAGQIRALKVNGHVERMRVKSVSVKEQWINRAWSDGQYPIYRGTITYEA